MNKKIIIPGKNEIDEIEIYKEGSYIVFKVFIEDEGAFFRISKKKLISFLIYR
jgi:hypothetical protein